MGEWQKPARQVDGGRLRIQLQQIRLALARGGRQGHTGLCVPAAQSYCPYNAAPVTPYKSLSVPGARPRTMASFLPPIPLSLPPHNAAQCFLFPYWPGGDIPKPPAVDTDGRASRAPAKSALNPSPPGHQPPLLSMAPLSLCSKSTASYSAQRCSLPQRRLWRTALWHRG